jgi:Ca2+-transporting ATPase
MILNPIKVSNKLNGLSNDQVKSQLVKYGYNELPTTTSKNILDIFIDVMREPMFILLVASATIYIFIGDYKEGLILLSATLIIIFITFFHYKKSENAIAALRKLSSPHALALRDNILQTIPSREIVPDDIVFLNEGDRVVADAILLENNHLLVDESILTGESMPVKKSIKKNDEMNGVETDTTNTNIHVYAGSLVVQGNAVVKVNATGPNSKFGKIGISINEIKEGISNLQVELKSLIKYFFIIGVLVSVAVVVAYYFSRGILNDAILNGIATSMAVLPEEFPVVLTVFLAIGAWRLSKINVLTRKPSAIETLGAVTVLCADKTGTITMNSMSIAFVYDGVTLFKNAQFKENPSLTYDLIYIAKLASDVTSANPMEKAIDDFVAANPLAQQLYSSLDKNNTILSFPLSNECACMTNIYASNENELSHVFTKGAPEHIFQLCALDDVEIEMHEMMLNALAKKSLRVIGIASAVYPQNTIPKIQTDLKLEFKGLIAFEDPIRIEVPDAMNECKAAGVKVKIITGDFPATAKSIAHQIGLEKGGLIVTGAELDTMSDSQLLDKMHSITIFARVIPSQKLRIVNVLKMQNEVVAMTGDGVNDAPALKAAHIGIAMGKRGTEVAREAASLVLLDDNFASIVAAIRQGRKIFDNLQKAMGYILAIHIPLIGLTLLPALFTSVTLILLPLHIICLELIIDPVASIAFESEKEEEHIMQRPPRAATTRFFGKQKILSSLIKGSSLLLIVLLVFLIGKKNNLNDQAIRTTMYATLVLGNIALVLNSLSMTRPFYYFLKHSNWVVMSVILFAIILLFGAVNIPIAQTLFKFENPGIISFLPVFLLVSIFLFAFEFQKYLSKTSR